MVRASCLLMSCMLVALLIAVPSDAYPSPNNNFRVDGPYEPEEVMSMINRLENMLEMERKMEDEKRGFDMGLGRGYSAAVQAKHLMGLLAANSAGGPGRKRRDAH